MHQASHRHELSRCERRAITCHGPLLSTQVRGQGLHCVQDRRPPSDAPVPDPAATDLQAAKADDAALAAWMKRVQGTTLARSSEPPDSLQIATDLLEPQAQAFWQRSGQLAGAPSAAACLARRTHCCSQG